MPIDDFVFSDLNREFSITYWPSRMLSQFLSAVLMICLEIGNKPVS